MQQAYLSVESEYFKEKILQQAQNFLFHTLTDVIFPAWLGTPWSFNGKTKTRGKGSIACGYFVVHTLQDAGFLIPTEMAKQPSENIIKNLIGSKELKRFVNHSSMENVIKWIEKKGEGIYIVGLDIHVGFIIYKNYKMTFLHSSYYNPPLKVVNQNIMGRSPLTESEYRVFGKLLDEKMVKKWLMKETFPIIYDHFNR